jgi:hypothetical protein
VARTVHKPSTRIAPVIIRRVLTPSMTPSALNGAVVVLVHDGIDVGGSQGGADNG